MFIKYEVLQRVLNENILIQSNLNRWIYRSNEIYDRKYVLIKEIESYKKKAILKIERPNKQKEQNLAFDTKFKPNIEGMYSIEVEFKGRRVWMSTSKAALWRSRASEVDSFPLIYSIIGMKQVGCSAIQR